MDAEFQEELVKLLPRLRRFAVGLTGNLDEGDDLVQQACEKALVKQDQWERGTRLDSWMYRIIRNQHIDSVRRQKIRYSSVEQGDEVLDIPDGRSENIPEVRDMADKVADIIDDLSDDQRSVILLVAVEGHSYSEVADMLEIPTGTVMSRLYRARARIMELISGGSPNLLEGGM